MLPIIKSHPNQRCRNFYFVAKPVEESQPVIAQSETPSDPEPQIDQEPATSPVAETQRRSSRVTSNDSGLEEDHFAPETPAANNLETPLVSPPEDPKSPVLDEEEPDGTRTHSVASPVFVGSKPEGKMKREHEICC